MTNAHDLLHQETFNAVFYTCLNRVPEPIASALAQGDTMLLSGEEQEERDKIANLLLGEAWQVTLALQLLENLPQLVCHLATELWAGLANHDWYEEDEVPFGAHAGKKIQELEREELVDLFFIANKLYEANRKASFIKSFHSSLLRRENLFYDAFVAKARKHEKLFGFVHDEWEVGYIGGVMCGITSTTYLPSEFIFGWDYQKMSNDFLAKILLRGRLWKISTNGKEYHTIILEDYFSEDIQDAMQGKLNVTPDGVTHGAVRVYFDENDVLQEAARRGLALIED